MRAVDTNVVVRILTRDDPQQTAAADEFISGGAWVSTLALGEVVWVLGHLYGLSMDEQAKSIEMLLNHRDLVLQEYDLVSAALDLFRAKPALGFMDCLVVESARKAENLPVGTFDRKLAKVEGTLLIGKSPNQPTHRTRSRRS